MVVRIQCLAFADHLRGLAEWSVERRIHAEIPEQLVPGVAGDRGRSVGSAGMASSLEQVWKPLLLKLPLLSCFYLVLL